MAGWLKLALHNRNTICSLPHCVQNFKPLPLWARSWQPS
jgi:hypothetical protein